MNFQHVPPPQAPYPPPPQPPPYVGHHPIFYPRFPPGIPHPPTAPPQQNPYILPNYHPPPGLPPPISPVQPPPPPLPPSARPLRTDNGWYVPQPQPQPQPPLPRVNTNVVYETNSRGGTPNEYSSSSTKVDSDGGFFIHPYWRGRLAPLPGSRSPPDTFSPRKETRGGGLVSSRPRAIEIKSAPSSSSDNNNNNNDIPTNTNPNGTTARQLLLPIAPSSSSGSSVLTRSSISSPINEQNPKPHEHEQLDKYADVFIPQYLKDIQNQPQEFSPLPPISIFPSPSYLNTFLPSSIIEQMQKLYPSTLLSFPPPSHSFSTLSPTTSSAEFGSSKKKDHPHQHQHHSLLSPSSPSSSTSPPEINVTFSPLTPPSYYNHFRSLLSWELDQLSLTKSQIVLYKTSVSVLDWDRSEFAVHVVGIRENHPRVDVGDVVHLREVLVEWMRGSGVGFEGRVGGVRKREGVIHFHCPSLRQHIQTYVPPMPGQPIRDGLPVFGPEHKIPQIFNISFLTNARPFLLMERAVATLSASLSSSSSGSGRSGSGNANSSKNNNTTNTKTKPKNLLSLAHKWLFPSPTDLDDSSDSSGETRPIPSIPPMLFNSFNQSHGTHGHGGGEAWPWIDGGLNEEQREAAKAIAFYQSPVPYLISGPPGTGKTRTIVETVHQILRVQPEACILLCAPSNPATDTLALRLGKVLKPHEMLRLNDENRTFAEVPDGIRQFCYVDNDKFALPPWKQLMSYRVVITCCLDANILVSAQCTNTTLGVLEDHAMGSIHPHRLGNRMRHQVVPHWTHLLIDEAAQGSEPELLIPISVVLTRPELLEQAKEKTKKQQQHARRASVSFNYHPLALTPQLVLCGDPNQLGPIIVSDEARAHELDVSLLERLFERPLYADHSEARSKVVVNKNMQSPPNGVENHHYGKPFKPFANLVKNYRSHPAILMPPSAMFYNDSLEPFATNGYISWDRLPNSTFPVVFLGCDSKEEDVSERATWYNPGEIACVVDTITSMMKDASKCSPLLTPDQIGVMAPWREQVWKMREALRKVGLGMVDVGSVEDYQGREKRVIIISCVRSSARFLKEDGEKGIGLVFEKKRMNVAITRAKELLVVIGNGELLKRDPYWKGFLQFALRNKLYVGPELVGLELDGAWISRLESRILQAQEENGLLDTKAAVGPNGDRIDEEERETMMLAGGVAREVLRED
ncbi:P-loop containing nucleoside triphosphate hydrolase protein [Dendrothele bispora CBS 962.96]|uniref:P-loop containing nucleoside triphosphate hydrolase protein n=1 Tax=Dendrothele bispora (strain CBS 962.96) TaxID=1314807 RepID=A0A4S8LIW4_DENBC|nr:P-loop containing nucleoside triphosphate hydrolase protein [Dendrothele bispora CBS 962.96]